MTKHFTDFDDYSYQVLQKIIDSAIALKNEHKSGIVID
jgi:ornithine carbamoyltransferase